MRNPVQTPTPPPNPVWCFVRAGLLMGFLLAACSTEPSPGPTLELPPSFSGTGVDATPDRWWRSFHDSRLNELESQALTRNFSLESSWQRLRQARAVVDRESADLFPDLTASADGQANAGGDPNPNQPRLGLGLGLGLRANYEADLWGRIRDEIKAEKNRARASLADYRTAALTLSAEVARTWYALVEAWEQRDLIGEQIETNGKILKQLQVRLAEGQGRSVDVLRQQQLLRATREQLTVAESNIGVLGNRLAVLQGRAPDSRIGSSERSLPDLPPPPRTGLPVQLVQRRPDLLGALARVQAVDADLAAAIKNRLPRLNFRMSYTNTEDEISRIFQNWIAVLVGELATPVIDGGERRAEVERQQARRAEFLADYQHAVLVAVREVEDSLVRERNQARRLDEIEKQIDLATRSYRQLLSEYLNGAGAFLDVLDSLTREQELQRQLLTARRNLIEFRIGLHRALAGGFQTTRELQ